MKNPKQTKKSKIIFASWLVIVISLFFYSFTQIDLGLTLTRVSFWQIIQRKFQSIGYFHRSLSTAFYLLILLALFAFYLWILKLAREKKLSFSQIWQLVLVAAFTLWFAYNAFSYDLFNYIFDAKIVTFYHRNPYRCKALDFPDDPMLGFMHWTHRLYPYGPLWLLVSLPLSFFGFQKLVLTMILFKGIAVLSYLGTVFLIDKILVKTNNKNRLLGVSFFAFNPLVMIESLVSAHNDILMMFLAVSAIWFLLRKKRFFAWLALFFSIGIKFATILLLPTFLLVSFLQLRKKTINWQKIWLFSLALMIIALLLAIKRTEFQPWYFLYPLPFVSLLPEKKWLSWLAISLSLGLLLRYAPFLYLGNWDPPVPQIKFWLTVLPVILVNPIYLFKRNDFR